MNIVNIRGAKRTGKITATTSLQLLLPANVHRIEVRFKNIAAANPVYLSNGKIELMDTTAAVLSASGTTLTNTTANLLAVNDVVRLDDELVLVTALPTTTTSTITRGHLNTTAVAHATSLTFYASRTHAAANAEYGYKLAFGTEMIDLSSNDAWYVLSTGGTADVEYLLITK